MKKGLQVDYFPVKEIFEPPNPDLVASDSDQEAGMAFYDMEEQVQAKFEIHNLKSAVSEQIEELLSQKNLSRRAIAHPEHLDNSLEVMFKKILKDQKSFADAPELRIQCKSNFCQDLYTVNIDHIKKFTFRAKAHHQKNPLHQKGMLSKPIKASNLSCDEELQVSKISNLFLLFQLTQKLKEKASLS